ncbi:MAG: M48 family metalloprotease, partial [Bacteroidetes bacterium]|nr:M48 family metalloprotease [Bacteroidota bacterium]
LPLTLCNNLTTAQVEAILVHELAHIRRNDFVLNLVVTLLEGLFFFNPFVRRLITDLRKEREHCCDDQVLEFRYDPQSYVSALLALASDDQQTTLAMAATGDRRDQLLLQRARRILLQQRTGERPGPFALIFLILLLAGVTLTRQGRAIAPPRPPQASKTQPVAIRPAAPMPVETEPAPKHTVFNQTATIPPAGRPKKDPPVFSSMAAVAKPKAEHVEEPEKVLVINTVADGDWKTGEEMVAIIQRVNRDYSMGQQRTEVPDQAKAKGLPFVPNASFSFHPVEEDTLRPEEKLARLQMETQREIAMSMQRLQLDLMAQLEMVKQRQQQLAENYSQEGQENLKQQRALIEQQLHLQRAYIQKLDELQKRLKKARRLTIVYI